MAPSQGSNRIIAFRADIDALIMDEDNIDLPYRSVNGCAHMCGHDGHTTSLLGNNNLTCYFFFYSIKRVCILMDGYHK
jgi:metal-dependent amidase/aminoacylase/carboxypeptidase family protein